MNTENMTRVRNRIRRINKVYGGEALDMNTFHSGDALKARGKPLCGTAGCIAGWTLAVRDGEFDALFHGIGSIESEAGAYLGISRQQAFSLFYLSGWPAVLRDRARESEESHGQLMEEILTGLLDGAMDFTARGALRMVKS